MALSRDLMPERYGSARFSRRTKRWALVVVAALFLAVVAYVGVRFADQGVRYDSVGYEHTSPTEITLTYTVIMRPGTTAHCSMQALNSNRGQVGFTEVDIPAQTEATTTHRVTIDTQQPAVSAEVMDCESS